MGFLSEYFLWIKAFHIIALISWMAMLFYLPRLFVYHAENAHTKEFVEIVKVQEKKLYTFIGSPAMGFTLITGILMLLANPGFLKSGGWLHAKLLLVALLLIYHFYCKKCMRELEKDPTKRSGKFYRAFNEVPTILLIGIVILVVIKPF
ncbi:protoporphyrinogen oxidase HemJ [Helicobacter cetorum]|uniref:protoporphyrinogen oxidase HemJ n=1 Tax=Helicobacter cetorum TaxID=138563 RepID=UPI000CF16186|nr:protoporphyrinogen oxidase HemJ [Helicobacter cetorum]